MKKIILRSTLAVVTVVAIWFAWFAYGASQNLVTLDVRGMDVREVVKKIEWQTWEMIYLHKEVEGKVTLNVKRVPLEEVLNILNDQISTRWSVIYPLYSGSLSLANLKKSVRGEIDPARNGWTNLQSRMGFRGGFGSGGFGGGFGGGGGRGGGGFGEAPRPQTSLVSLEFQDKDVSFATLALDRFSQARVVPEDGVSAKINLKLDQAPVPKAVAAVAKQAKRNWTTLYVMTSERGRGGPGGPGDMARGPGGPGPDQAGPGEDRGDRRGRDREEVTPEQRDERRKEMETLNQELQAALPADERQKLEVAQQEREKQRQEFQNMTDEQRRARFQQMGGGNRDTRQLSRINNTTPQQRAERAQQMQARRERFQSQGGQGGQGGGRGGRGAGR